MGNHVGNPRHATTRRERRVGLSPYARHGKHAYEYTGEAASFRKYVQEHHVRPNDRGKEGLSEI